MIRSSGRIADVEARYLGIRDLGVFRLKVHGTEKQAKRFFDLVRKNLGG